MENKIDTNIQQNDWNIDRTIQFINLRYLTDIFKYPLINL